MPVFLINGQVQDHIAAADRGLQYGDGLFETIAILDGKPQHWERHLRRLACGCDRLNIPYPGDDLLWQELRQVLIMQPRAVLKIVLTRGAGGRGYRPPAEIHPTRILSLHEWPDYPPSHRAQGVAVRLCRTPLGRNPALAGLKHLNRLEQVLARGEWSDPASAEGLMLDGEGLLIEGTMSNVFLGRGGELYTPDLGRCGVAGIMREVVLDACRDHGIPVAVRDIPVEELTVAEEIFLTNSLIGLWPVTCIAAPIDRPLPIGPVTTRVCEILSHARALP